MSSDRGVGRLSRMPRRRAPVSPVAHNFSTGADAQVNHSLSLLAKATYKGPVRARHRLVPGIFFDFTDGTPRESTVALGGLGLLRLTASLDLRGGWFALHMELGKFDLDPSSAVVLLAKTSAPQAISVRPCLRSGTEGGFVDSFARKRLVSYGEPSVHLDVLTLGAPKTPPGVTWRELIWFFDSEEVDLRIHDLRIAVL